jgi:decaprenylphospho-beta-D-ribofuranose 2-oxidase
LGRLSVPLDFPALALNPLSIAAFNEVYFRRVPQWGRVSEKHFLSFLYPLDAIGGWNRIYGKRGFFQFQCVVPFSSGEAALRKLLGLIAASRKASFLAVLKRMGPGRAGFLSFPMAGWTLALDFPAGEGVAALYAKLAEVTAAYGGRVYLAKDALLTARDMPGMYPELSPFQDVVDRVDPDRRLQSDMSRRLALHRGAA